MVTRREIRLSPSNLNYEDRRCNRCFAEAVNGETWPQGPFPGIFAKLDSQQRRYFADRPTSDVDPGLPPGTPSPSRHPATPAACATALWAIRSVASTA